MTQERNWMLHKAKNGRQQGHMPYFLAKRFCWAVQTPGDTVTKWRLSGSGEQSHVSLDEQITNLEPTSFKISFHYFSFETRNREKGGKCHEIHFLSGKKIKKLQVLSDEHLA